MTTEQIQTAEQALAGARTMIEAGTLFVSGVAVKAVTRSNVMAIFPPGVREVVRRYLRGY